MLKKRLFCFIFDNSLSGDIIVGFFFLQQQVDL